jgi:hypothetical protein
MFLALSQDCRIGLLKVNILSATWFCFVQFCIASFGELWQNDCLYRYHDCCVENLSTSTQMTSECICPFCSLLQSDDLLENQIHVKVAISSFNFH